MPDRLLATSALPQEAYRVNGMMLSLAPQRVTVSIGPFAGRLGELNAALKKAFKVTLPEDFITVAGPDGLLFTRAAHNQWLCSAPEGTDLLATLSTACQSLAALTNQSDSRVTLTLSGKGAESIVAKLVALDLHPSVFVPGQTALTLAGHVPVILTRHTDATAYDFTVFRSLAQSLHHDIFAAMNGGIPTSERVCP
ncbi:MULTISPECIES: sarcosine oxidase subunit gamma [Acetobacter]|uniref:Sarcosine oxidase subunit gamma n=1 Tax=Acetobacter thailandicus TaxID=1502842 RepID=A0ABT3QC41_9PROT|nr:MULTISPECIES: sarcosine oxidase subunit gamma family protein [Acetobacter]MBS0958986.1 sarcosine oxidase subunit gamma [Acetobacter thailandicus]MBS0980340.1 sarcosine oxidase subunit gamma [Acetobacter thailandicus]MBS0987030.1 sarcosine oxidase subunit gamma [Acetobacter thailandicus]MBS1003334.1 sarcosine oxidase subunit gamma [Acetobacter thailandicus]MCX2562831.1 sarcosine oxidase subunit gamma [Acetobacter thailandicus]